MNNLTLDGRALIGVLFAALALGLLAGAALGYYTASSDLQRERKEAYDVGFQLGIETAWDLIGPDARKLSRVHGRLAPAPPHVIIPNPDPEWAKASALFDQDAPSEAAVALELRGDD